MKKFSGQLLTIPACLKFDHCHLCQVFGSHLDYPEQQFHFHHDPTSPKSKTFWGIISCNLWYLKFSLLLIQSWNQTHVWWNLNSEEDSKFIGKIEYKKKYYFAILLIIIISVFLALSKRNYFCITLIVITMFGSLASMRCSSTSELFILILYSCQFLTWIRWGTFNNLKFKKEIYEEQEERGF